MGWVQVILGAIMLGREIFQYLEQKEKNKKKRALLGKQMRLAIRRAREQGKTDDIEEMLGKLRAACDD